MLTDCPRKIIPEFSGTLAQTDRLSLHIIHRTFLDSVANWLVPFFTRLVTPLFLMP